MLEQILSLLEVVKQPYIFITILVWITYKYTLRCGAVSDDHQGIGDYDGKLQGLVYGMISRWVRYHLCGGNYPSKIRFPDGKNLPEGKLFGRHHFLSVSLFNISILFLYTFLEHLFGSKIALITCSLFVVSPIGTQCVAWVSGLGYPLSLIWILIALNSTTWFYMQQRSIVETVLFFLFFILVDIMAINALFVALALPAILVFFGYYPFAILSALISIVIGLRIVRHTIKIRADAFKEQDMGKLTKVNPRRIVVAFKTILYYLELLIWPNRLGLYHEWGNNLSPDLERIDRRFFLGLLATLGLVGIFFLTPIIEVKLGILWFFAFIFIFLNWITIQQFVTERYLWIPSIGFYLIVAYALQDYQPLIYLIGGILICRTWLHLPTYDDELRFYLSNTWNFQNSETALANLGCTWIRIGNVGSALDAWHASHKSNPDYDVPLANIYFHHRSNAMLDVEHGNYESAIEKFKIAYKYIEACNKCTIRHFKDNWARELRDVTSWIANPLILVISERKRLNALHASLVERRAKPDEKDIPGIDVSLMHIKQRLQHIEEILSKTPKDKIPDEGSVEPTRLILPGQEKK